MRHETQRRGLILALFLALGLLTVSSTLFGSSNTRSWTAVPASHFKGYVPLVIKEIEPTLTRTTTPTATRPATASATRPATASATRTPTRTATSLASQTANGSRTPTRTLTPTPTRTATAAASSDSPVFFPVGPGASDVVPHQILRTSNDRLYLFTSQQYSTTIRAYWTSATGLPNSQAAFDRSAAVNAGANPISVEAVGDGGHFVHVLSNLNNGELRDYPFNLNTGAFGSSVLLASGDPTILGDYLGSSGLSAMLDQSGTLHIAYWAAGNHIAYRAYSVNTTTGALSLSSGPTTLDVAGSANHPSLAVSPLDNSLTVAWISQALTTAQILARSRSSSGAWGSVETVSSSPVWTSVNSGINIDQGPSLLIDASGIKHLAYIENYDLTGAYGHIH
jgi:hypothetical protein